jgi:hypothetical protein
MPDSTGLFRLSQKAARAFGELFVDDDSEGMFREEGRDAPHRGTERAERRGCLLVFELAHAESFGRATQRAAQAVEREVASRERQAARLKIPERIEYDSLGVNAVRGLLCVKEWRLAHPAFVLTENL